MVVTHRPVTKTMTMMGTNANFLVGAFFLSFLLFNIADGYTIRVCRNKHCCKKNPYLLETIYDLVSSVDDNNDSGNNRNAVESSGCLSRCDYGPNVEVESNREGGGLTILNEMNDATMASVQLELALETKFPKLIVAAAKVMERAAKSKDPSEQEMLLSSVINKLEASEEHAQYTAAIAHAYALRSKAFLDQSKWLLAIGDARNAVSLLDKASSQTVTMAYRSWVDAEEGQGSHPTRIISILQAWFKAQPQYRTKLKGEITDWAQRT